MPCIIPFADDTFKKERKSQNYEDKTKMPKDDILAVPSDILEKIKARGWKICTSGFDDILCDEAQEDAIRARKAFQSKEIKKEQGAAAAAILCAAAACEARVSEYLAHWEFAGGTLPDELEKIRGRSDALEQWRLLLRRQAPDYSLETSREYQHLGCLFRLRDLVAHRNARLREVDRVPERVSDCVKQGIIPIRDVVSGEWMSFVLVYEVGDWAVKTALQWLIIADKLVPLVC